MVNCGSIPRGRLTPDAGVLLLRALDAARETLYQRRRASEAVLPPTDPAAEAPTRAQQQADALALLAETALHQGLDPGAPGERYQVVVHVDAAVLADPEQPGQSVLEEGSHVPAGTSRRLACDASRVVMRHDGEGRVVEVGAGTRTIPQALRRALQHRDGSCRFPGGRPLLASRRRLQYLARQRGAGPRRGQPVTLTLPVLWRRYAGELRVERGAADRTVSAYETASAEVMNKLFLCTALINNATESFRSTRED